MDSATFIVVVAAANFQLALACCISGIFILTTNSGLKVVGGAHLVKNKSFKLELKMVTTWEQWRLVWSTIWLEKIQFLN